MLVVPGVMGIGLWSPPLDSLGNSVRGVNFAEVISLVLYSSLVSYHCRNSLRDSIFIGSITLCISALR